SRAAQMEPLLSPASTVMMENQTVLGEKSAKKNLQSSRSKLSEDNLKFSKDGGKGFTSPASRKVPEVFLKFQSLQIKLHRVHVPSVYPTVPVNPDL
ncbi:hypothetical protein ATANTOWER_017192, partial [Ataeniobius toweri]|nr:hypothetical protein [Ataeniobius toweri]